MSKLADDVARGVYRDDAEMFDRDLKSLIDGQTARVRDVSSWAQEQLRIMAEMADDRDLKWVADKARRIAEGLSKP